MKTSKEVRVFEDLPGEEAMGRVPAAGNCSVSEEPLEDKSGGADTPRPFTPPPPQLTALSSTFSRFQVQDPFFLTPC